MKCKICDLFDCGFKCNCVCHAGSTSKIRHDLNPSGNTQVQQITSSDVELVAEQTGVSFETARQYLKKHNGDMAGAILDIGTWKK